MAPTPQEKSGGPGAPALRVGPNPGPELEPFLVWQRRIRLCQPGDGKSKIDDLVRPPGLVGCVILGVGSVL